MIKIFEQNETAIPIIIKNGGKRTYYTTQDEINKLNNERNYIWVTPNTEEIVDGKLIRGGTVAIYEIDDEWLKANRIAPANAWWRKEI
jgi:hypothetical protein